MITVFDLEKLENLLRDFYKITQIRITVFDADLNELVSYPQSVAPYCKVIRSTAKGLQACVECDRRACAAALIRKRTYIYRCHAGLTEAVSPLFVGNVPVGYLLFGHVFPYASQEEGLAVISELTKNLSINERMLREAVEQAVPVNEGYVRSAAHILYAVASYLILDRMAVLNDEMLAARLDSYISAHFTEHINAEGLSEILGIGKTQLYAISRELYEKGIASRMRELRMTQAKKLLSEQKSLPLTEVAAQCGYLDYNYFSTVFKRETGCTPGQWRKNK